MEVDEPAAARAEASTPPPPPAPPPRLPDTPRSTCAAAIAALPAATAALDAAADLGSVLASHPELAVLPPADALFLARADAAGAVWAAEEAILRRAADIEDDRQRRGRPPAPDLRPRLVCGPGAKPGPPGAPGPGGQGVKSHWEYLLSEGTWLAKEFARERRWKALQARKFVRAGAKSGKDVEARATGAAKEVVAADRRRASWISREVGRFWTRAERVVAFKRAATAEAVRRRALDKHLAFLVGQTQKYSALLAARMTDGAGVAAVSAPAAPSASLRSPSAAAAPSAAVAAGPSSPPPPATAYDAMDDDADYVASDGASGAEDDEATLEEEERLAGAGGAAAAREEAAALAADADLPIEALLARYGYGGGGAVSPPPRPIDGSSSSEEEEGGGGGPDPDLTPAARPAKRARPVDPALAALVAPDDAVGAGLGAPSAAAGPAAAAPPSPSRDAGDDDGEWVADGADDDGADDEATLEEEERLAGAGGAAAAREEAAALAAEADIPIEALLARYGMVKEEAPGGGGGVGGGGGGGAAAKPAPPAAQPAGSVSSMSEDDDDDAAPSQPDATNKEWARILAGEGEHALPAGLAAATATKAEGKCLVSGGGAPKPPPAQPASLSGPAALPLATPVPFLLKHSLRDYQHVGLDWLVSIADRRINGILADEMGLGKTIQTIALLAHWAASRGVWGPHLIVVPTSVMLNWEMEFKKWCPAFKLLTYYGGVRERKAKRQGWSKPGAFHVCITSYTLVLQDAKIFRRKRWQYLILDEAHMIKNWKSQRWQTLLNFHAKRRLLITGTPLQNDLMELWSLMHFLMPQVFSSHDQFRDWFSNPLTGMVEGDASVNRDLVGRLHGVLRPFLLRRLKSEVEKKLPGKHEHVVRCRLSRRQRALYDDYIGSSAAKTALAGGGFLGVVNVLMQLRKVCNHPDLFEARPIVSAFDMPRLEVGLPSIVLGAASGRAGKITVLQEAWESGGSGGAVGRDVDARVPPDAAGGGALRPADADALLLASPLPDPLLPDLGRCPGLLAPSAGCGRATWEVEDLRALAVPGQAVTAAALAGAAAADAAAHAYSVGGAAGAAGAPTGPTASPDLLALERALPAPPTPLLLEAAAAAAAPARARRAAAAQARTALAGSVSGARCAAAAAAPLIARDTVAAVTLPSGGHLLGGLLADAAADAALALALPAALATDGALLVSPTRRAARLESTLSEFVFAIPRARAPPAIATCAAPDPSESALSARRAGAWEAAVQGGAGPLHTPATRLAVYFPDRRLIQYDAGKLQELAALLGRLKAGGHRVLIFTQMSKMLDVLEAFLNLHGHTYCRLDGSTKPETRQVLMQRFNADPKLFAFILSTRSGGVGMNLTGADTVIFYDADWNPAMDAQAQDRCHRIGQTREVHIYRLVSEHTVEENILAKSDQKRNLDHLAIQSGGFNTDLLLRINPRELLGLPEGGEEMEEAGKEGGGGGKDGDAPAPAAGAPANEEELAAALRAAEDEGDADAAAAAEREAAAEAAEFTAEPPPPGPDAEGGGRGTGSPSPDAAAAQPAADPMIAGGLAELEARLRPVERLAVRLIEDAIGGLGEPEPGSKEAVAAEAALGRHEWDLNAVEAARAAADADVDADPEAARVATWDPGAAKAEYRAALAAAEAEAAAVEEAAAVQAAQFERAAAVKAAAHDRRVTSPSPPPAPGGRATTPGAGGGGGLAARSGSAGAAAGAAYAHLSPASRKSRSGKRKPKGLPPVGPPSSLAAVAAVAAAAAARAATPSGAGTATPGTSRGVSPGGEGAHAAAAALVKRARLTPGAAAAPAATAASRPVSRLGGGAGSRASPASAVGGGGGPAPAGWPPRPPLPWEPAEDAVLTAVAAAASAASAGPLGPAVWAQASTLLAAGAAAAGVGVGVGVGVGARASGGPGGRTPAACRARYSDLLLAARAARGVPAAASAAVTANAALAARVGASAAAEPACEPAALAGAVAAATLLHAEVVPLAGTPAAAAAAGATAALGALRSAALAPGAPPYIHPPPHSDALTPAPVDPGEAAAVAAAVERGGGAPARGAAARVGPGLGALASGGGVGAASEALRRAASARRGSPGGSSGRSPSAPPPA